VAFGLTPGGSYKVRVNGESGTKGEYFLTRNFINFIPVVTNVAVASPINENVNPDKDDCRAALIVSSCTPVIFSCQ
jgi:hypothetical protein